MTYSPISPQATTIFKANLYEIERTLEKDILLTKQRFNERGILNSSLTVSEIYENINQAIIKMVNAAYKSVVASYESSEEYFSDSLESDLVNAFEENFGFGFKKLCAIRIEATLPIKHGLLASQLTENNDHFQIAKNEQLIAQSEIRKYFQTIKRSKKKWYEYIPGVAKLLSLLS